jgi:hypothetical protein
VKENKIKNGLGMNSQFFQCPLKPVSMVAAFSMRNLINQINPYLVGITNIYKFNTSSSHLVLTLSKLILLFVYIVALHDSRFITALYKQDKYIIVPDFLQLIMVKICSRVKSNNKITSWTEGSLDGQDFDLFVDAILNMNQKDWIDALSGTPFYRCASDHRNFVAFKQVIVKMLTLKEGEIWVDVLTNEMAFFREAVSQHSTLNYFSGYLSSEVSIHLGIYRFHSSDEPDVYYVTQSSCAGVSLGSLDLFACFLRIFKPEFSIGETGVLPKYLLPGDSVFDTSAVDYKYCWEKYLSYSPISTGDTPTGVPKRNQVIGNTSEKHSFFSNEESNSDSYEDETVSHCHLDGRTVYRSLTVRKDVKYYSYYIYDEHVELLG